MMYQVRIRIMPKDGVADPQGSAVKQALHTMNFNEVADVCIGKMVEVSLEGKSKESVEERIRSISEELLVNPNIEKYLIDLVEEASV